MCARQRLLPCTNKSAFCGKIGIHNAGWSGFPNWLLLQSAWDKLSSMKFGFDVESQPNILKLQVIVLFLYAKNYELRSRVGREIFPGTVQLCMDSSWIRACVQARRLICLWEYQYKYRPKRIPRLELIISRTGPENCIVQLPSRRLTKFPAFQISAICQDTKRSLNLTMDLRRMSIFQRFWILVCAVTHVKHAYNKRSAVKWLVETANYSGYTAARSGACVCNLQAADQPIACKRLACEFCKWNSRTDLVICKQSIVKSVCAIFYNDSTQSGIEPSPTLQPDLTSASIVSDQNRKPTKPHPSQTKDESSPVSE